MKIPVTLALVCCACTLFAQKNEPVRLEWKIGEKETLRYLTQMEEVKGSASEVNFDHFFRAFADSSSSGVPETRDFFRQLNNIMQKIDLVTTLSNKGGGVVDIVMVSREKEPKPDSTGDNTDNIIRLMQQMNEGVMLRGSVFATGGIHSFWLKSAQKNLVAMMFELPNRAVSVGDTWPIDVSLIANDQNFVCDSACKINQVQLIGLEAVQGETIATLKYHIEEYVNGTFNMPSFMSSGGPKPVMFKYTIQILAEFSVDKGHWNSYDGIMSLKATGMMSADQKTRYMLKKE